MTQEEWKSFEGILSKRGYKKWTQAKYGQEDFDMSIIVKDKSIEDEYRYKYQLIFRFWNFEQFKEGAGYSVDFVVMPCIDGRMDAICSDITNDFSKNVEFAEKFAKNYYEFIIKQIEK